MVTDELNVSLGIFGVRQKVNGINVGNSGTHAVLSARSEILFGWEIEYFQMEESLRSRSVCGR